MPLDPVMPETVLATGVRTVPRSCPARWTGEQYQDNHANKRADNHRLKGPLATTPRMRIVASGSSLRT